MAITKLVYFGSGIGVDPKTKQFVSMRPESTPTILKKILGRGGVASSGGGGGQTVIPASVRKESKTDVQLASERSKIIKDIRKSAGIFGRGLSEVQERRVIKRYIAEQQPKQTGRVRTGAKAVIEDDRVILPLQTGQLTISKGEERIIPERKPSFKEMVSKTREEISPKIFAVTPKKIIESQFPSQQELSANLKFLLFSPAMATTPQILSQIKPVTETKFLARVGTVSKSRLKVDVISVSKTGGKQTTGLSSQILRDIDSTVSIAKSKTFLLERGGLITKIKGGGGVKDIGIAKQIRQLETAMVERPVGKGIFSRTGSLEVLKARFNKGLRIGIPKTDILPVEKKLRISDVTGTFIRKKDMTYFLGTETPTTRISKTGISKIIKEPEITGIIGYKKFPTVSRSYSPVTESEFPRFDIFPSSKKGQVALPKKALKAIEKSVLEQVMTLRSQSIPTDIGKIRQFPVLFPSLNIRPKSKTKPLLRLKTPSTQKTRIQPELSFRDITITRQKPITSLKQFQRIKTVSIPKFRVSNLMPRISIPRFDLNMTREPIIPFGFKLPSTSKKRKKRLGKRGREGFGISEGFVAKTFGFKPVTIKEKDLSRYISKIGSIGIRRGVRLR